MDKKYKKEIDKEVKDIHKTTLMVNNRMQKIFGLKEEKEEESDEENEEIEDYLNDVNDEEVSSILLKAEKEKKEEEEEKKREKKEKEENDEKMERYLKEELERISDDEKEKKKKKKKKEKKKKKKEEKEEEEEEDSYDDFEEYKRWKKMRKMQREKKKEENNKKKEIKENIKNREEKSDEEKEEINNKENNKKQEKIIKNIDNNTNYKAEVKGGNKHNDKQDDKHNDNNDNKNNDNNDNKEEKDMEFDFNINNINNNLNKEGDNNLNNNDDNNLNNNNNFDNNNINNDANNNSNNAPQNNKQGPIIPKNVYDQVSSTDKKVITDLLRAGNAKYQEGEIFSSTGKYSEALKCYYQAKNLFLGINKLVQTKKNAYPKEFRMIITSKINDKLKLVHQSAKMCSSNFKDKRIGQLINKNTMINNPNNNNIGNTMNNNISNTVNNNIKNTLNNNNIGNTMNNNINKTVNNNINNTLNNNLNKKNSNDINNILSKNQNTNNNINNNNKDMNNYNFDFNALNNDNNNNANNNKNIKLGNTNKPQNNPNKPKSLHDKEEDAMDQKILSEIMTKNPGVKFSDIIGMNDMKQTLYEIIVVPTIRPDLFTGIRTPQRGILLFGPPGTGKTMIAKAIASECGSTFFNISASSLTSKWVGESEKTVKSLFKIAYQKVPSIIFIDEIDSILSKRSESENEATKRLKTEFLIQFDGLGSNTSARLLVIAATNRPMDLDEALLRRLPKRVYCGPLDEDGRFEFIKKVINRVETDLSDEDIREIAKMTNDYSNSDLMELCREAAYKPVRELTNEEIMKLDKFRPINKKDLVDAAHKIRGTLSKKVKDELRKWNEQFGGV